MRDNTVARMSKVCLYRTPSIQPLSGETFNLASTSIEDSARAVDKVPGGIIISENLF